MDKVEYAKSSSIKLIIETETGVIFKENVLQECPFCKSGTGKNKSSAFSIKPTSNIFKCFSCGKSGNPIEFIKYFHSYITDKESIDYILKRYSSYVFEEKPQNLDRGDSNFQKTIFAIQQNDISNATEYLRKRGVKVDQLPKSSYYYDSYEDAVVFIDSTRILANKRLIKPENGAKAKFIKGSTIINTLYDCTFIPANDVIFITEGVINALSLLERSAIAIFTTGNKFTDVEKISKYIKGKKVVLAFDSDEAGLACKVYYEQFILNAGIQIKELSKLKLPLDRDVNDLAQIPDIEYGSELAKFLADSSNFEMLWQDQNDISILLKPIPKDSEDSSLDFEQIQLFKKDGRYWTRESTRGKKSIDIVLSNFLMEILFHFVDGTNNTRRLIKIQRYTGEIEVIEILSSETKSENFETILKSHNCTFLGNSFQLKTIFMELMDHQRMAYAIDMLGLIPQHNIYAFSDCIINDKNAVVRANSLGIVSDNNKNYYLPAHSESNVMNKAFENIRKFRYLNGSVNFQSWSMLINEAYNVNGSIGICFMILALFRDIVFAEVGFMPFLFLFGQAGVGKTSFIDSLLRLFGEKDIGISLRSTFKAISRSAEQRKNAFVFYKEYHNAMDRSQIDFFKNAYDGALYSIAQATGDNKTTSFYAQSAFLIDGNVLPTAESALFDRMIVLAFENDTFTKEQTIAHRILNEESEKGLGQILKEILKYREYFKYSFKSCFKDIYNDIKYKNSEINGFCISTLPERTLKHIALLLTAFKLMSVKLNFPFEYDALFNKIIQDSIEKYQMLTDIKDVTIFWDAINWDRKKDQPTIQELKFYIKDLEKGVIYMKINDLYSVYMSYCKRNNINFIDKSSLNALLTASNYPPFISGKQKGRNKTIYKRGLGECYMYRFEYNQLDNILIINKREVFL